MKRTITPDEYDTACEMLYQLTDILLAVGIVELKISKKEKEIFWDTENGGKVNPEVLDKVSQKINDLFFDVCLEAMQQ